MNRRARDGNCRGIAADDRRIHPSHCFALLEVLCVYLTPDTGFKAIVTDTLHCGRQGDDLLTGT